MTRRLNPTLISTIFALSGLALGQSVTPRGGQVISRADDSFPDRLVVQHRLGTDSAAAQRLFRAHGARVYRHHDSLNVSVLRVDPAQRDQILASLEGSGLFNFVEPDYVAHGTLIPNDPN